MNRTMNLKGFCLVVGIMLVVFLVLQPLIGGKKNEKADQEYALREKLAQLEQQNRDLTEQLSVVGTKDYIVSSAIENYDYMNKDDIRFVFSNPEALYAYSEEELQILMDELAE